jgi:hypothetical protein
MGVAVGAGAGIGTGVGAADAAGEVRPLPAIRRSSPSKPGESLPAIRVLARSSPVTWTDRCATGTCEGRSPPAIADERADAAKRRDVFAAKWLDLFASGCCRAAIPCTPNFIPASPSPDRRRILRRQGSVKGLAEGPPGALDGFRAGQTMISAGDGDVLTSLSPTVDFHDFTLERLDDRSRSCLSAGADRCGAYAPRDLAGADAGSAHVRLAASD